MTLEVLQRCHANALAVSGRIRLPLRSRVWKGQAGEFTGGGTGSSMDFQDHRAYSPGDDPRHINWQAYARTGSYTMKLFREEVRPVVDLILDASESMFFDETKAIRDRGAFLSDRRELASRRRVSRHPRGQGRRHHPAGSGDVAFPPVAGKGSLASTPDPSIAPDLARIPLRGNSIRVFLSDLLFSADPDPILRHLVQRHGSPVILSPFLLTESRPEWSGNYEFVDPERTPDHPHRIEPATLRRYQDAYVNHFALWKQHASRYQAAFARIPAEEDLAAVLFREAVPAGALEPSR